MIVQPYRIRCVCRGAQGPTRPPEQGARAAGRRRATFKHRRSVGGLGGLGAGRSAEAGGGGESGDGGEMQIAQL